MEGLFLGEKQSGFGKGRVLIDQIFRYAGSGEVLGKKKTCSFFGFRKCIR